jgi:hypothetical protein
VKTPCTITISSKKPDQKRIPVLGCALAIKVGMFITYDLPQIQTGQSSPSNIVPGAKEIKIDGHMVRWKVGEFHHASGKHIYGAQILFTKSGESIPSEELIELPENAQNVQVHQGLLPEKYQSALKSAA